jgi:hypothetical protein
MGEMIIKVVKNSIKIYFLKLKIVKKPLLTSEIFNFLNISIYMKLLFCLKMYNGSPFLHLNK